MTSPRPVSANGSAEKAAGESPGTAKREQPPEADEKDKGHGELERSARHTSPRKNEASPSPRRDARFVTPEPTTVQRDISTPAGIKTGKKSGSARKCGGGGAR